MRARAGGIRSSICRWATGGTALVSGVGLASCVVAVGAIAGGGTAEAGPVPAVTCGTLVVPVGSTNYQFSEFTTGPASRTNTDSQGSVAYGGTFTGNFSVAQNSLGWPKAQLTYFEGGNVGVNPTASQVNMQSGSAAIAGSISSGSHVYTNSGGTATTGSTLPFSFSTVGSALVSCANSYGSNATTTAGTATVPQTGALNLTATGSTNVFTITADQLAAAQNLYLGFPAGSTNLIDVVGSSDHLTSLSLSGINSINIGVGCSLASQGSCSQPSPGDNSSTAGKLRDNTVWNFAPAVGFSTGYSLTFGSWNGQIVAPGSAVTLNSGAVNGSVFAASLTGAGQTNDDPFGGTIPSSADPIPQTPEGLPVLMGGAALLGFGGVVLRRRRQLHAR